MYSAAALLPSTLPRSAIVTAPLSTIEDSSISETAASATFGLSTLDASWVVRAVVSARCVVVPCGLPSPRRDHNPKVVRILPLSIL
jgi:hypothetical protein